MKISETQIEQLYKFTRQHYVYHYDVQTELVDHLANDIEKIWEEHPKLSFEEARDKSFKKFGIFGFMDVVEKKERQMTKRYYKIVLRFIKEWYKLPKIILTLVLFFGFYQLQKNTYSHIIYTSIFYGIISLQFMFLLIKGNQLKKKRKKTGKSWMFEHILIVNGMANICMILFFFFDFSFAENDFLVMSDFRRILSAFLVTFILILGYITLYVIPRKTEELLQETYPEYKLVKNL